MIDAVLGLMFIIYPHVFRFPEHSALFFFIVYGVSSLIVVALTDSSSGTATQ